VDVVAVLSFLIFFRAGPTSNQTGSQVARALEARYRHAQTLKATFLETYRDGNGALSAESGTVYFSRPGRMRWEYESPQEKLFLVDGANAWFYIPADRTASRAKFKESSDWRTPLALLAGQANLSHLCRALEIVPESQRQARDGREISGGVITTLRCLPRITSDDSGNPVREILLQVDAEAHLVGVRIREAGDWEIAFHFANWEQNISIPELKFHFLPPPGVSIVDESALAGAMH
jgi:outer membrane lipoprotein carrier protein